MKLPISVFIITLNEEAHLEKTLKSVQDCAEIIVVDSGSTDKTCSIAQKYGAQVIHHEWLGYARQKQLALSYCSQEWALNLDGDEELTPECLSSIKKVIVDDKYACVRFKRNDIFIGKPLSKWSKKPNNLRFYKSKNAYFDESRYVHESASVKGKELYIDDAFNHYGYATINSLNQKNNTYSTLKAKEKFTKGKSFSTTKLVLAFPLFFCKEYFLQRKFMSGKRGFLLAVIKAYYAFSKEAKLYECYENSKLHNK